MVIIQLQIETAHIEARHNDFGLGTGVMLSLIGKGRTTRPRLVAVESGPEGIREGISRSFIKQYSTPLEFLSGVDRESGQQALDYVTDWLLMWGYDPQGQDPIWYGRRFWRPYIPSDRLTEADRELVAAVDDFLLNNPYNSHAWANRAYYNKKHVSNEAAKDAAERALRIRPSNVLAIAVLAEACLYMGDLSRARSLARKAVDLAPGFEYPEVLLKEMR